MEIGKVGPKSPPSEVSGQVKPKSSRFGLKKTVLDTAIGAIRLKTPASGRADNRKWVQLKVQGEQPVLASVESLAKRTGLAPHAITASAKKGKLEQTVQESIQAGDYVKKTIEGASQQTKTGTLSSDGIKSSFKHAFLKDYVPVKTGGWFSSYAKASSLSHVLGVSEEAIREASKKGRLMVRTEGTQSTISVNPPAAQELAKTILKTRQLVAQEMSHTIVEKSLTGRLSERVKVLDKGSLSVVVSPEGEMYLGNMAQKLGSGSYKTVYAGMRISTGESVAIGLPNRSPEKPSEEHISRDLQEVTTNLMLSGRKGFVNFHTGFKIVMDGGTPYESSGVIHISHLYEGTLSDLQKSPKSEKIKKFQERQQAGGEERLADLRKIVDDLTHGLKEIHGAELLWRDIKPDNILLKLNEDGSVESACLADAGFVSEASKRVIEGTPVYYSPDLRKSYNNAKLPRELRQEQFIRPQNKQDDRWALGTSLYPLVLGKSPDWIEHGNEQTLKEIQKETCMAQFRRDAGISEGDKLPDDENGQLLRTCWNLLFEEEGVAQRGEVIRDEEEEEEGVIEEEVPPPPPPNPEEEEEIPPPPS